jgi:hypothetical protein
MARQYSMYFMKRHTVYSLAKIGELLGGFDHATTLHGNNVINNLIEYNGYQFKLNEMRTAIQCEAWRIFRLKRIRFHYRAMRAKAGRLRAILTASKLLAEVNL